MCHIIVMSSQKVSGEASLECLHMDMHKSMRPKKIIRNMEHTAVLHAESQTQDSQLYIKTFYTQNWITKFGSTKTKIQIKQS